MNNDKLFDQEVTCELTGSNLKKLQIGEGWGGEQIGNSTLKTFTLIFPDLGGGFGFFG